MTTTVSGSQFTAAVEASFARVPLVNTDGYSVPQYVFVDEEDAAFFHGADKAKLVYVAVDSRRGYTKIAPVVEVDGVVFGNASEAFEVFDDEIKAI